MTDIELYLEIIKANSLKNFQEIGIENVASLEFTKFLNTWASELVFDPR